MTAPSHLFFKALFGSLLALLCLSCAYAQGTESSPTDFHYANNLQIEQFPTHRLITVRNINRESQAVFHYALVPKGQPLPKLPAAVTVIRTPVQRVIVMATTFVGYIDALDRIESIIGVADPQFVNHPGLQAQIKSGHTRNVQTGQSMDIENVLLLQPDLILASSSGNPLFDIHPQLARSGLPVVLSAAYMEQHPLARAEWLRFVAAFFELDDFAEHAFADIAQRYENLRDQARDRPNRPTVLANAPYSGTWHVPGGASYSAQAIRDAGADYIWADDDSAGGIPLDLERVFAQAAEADIWINPSSYRSLHQLLGADPRFDKFKAFDQGSVFNNTRQLNAGGGNNIWERGVVHPDEVLADLIKIFHPQLLPEHAFNFYHQLR